MFRVIAVAVMLLVGSASADAGGNRVFVVQGGYGHCNYGSQAAFFAPSFYGASFQPSAYYVQQADPCGGVGPASFSPYAYGPLGYAQPLYSGFTVRARVCH